MNYEREIQVLKEKTDDLLKASRLLRISNVVLCAALILHIIEDIFS